MNTKRTKWAQTKKFFNSFKVGDAIPRGFYLSMMPPSFGYTVDSYRCYLNRAGYLLQGSGKSIGIYVLVKKIPNSLTLSKVLQEAYGYK